MPDFDQVITDFVQGDDLEILRDILNVPDSDPLVEAWLTMKADPLRDTDAESVIAPKVVTTANNPGVGQITDDGDTDNVGEVRFDLVPADTVLLRADRTYHFDVQVRTSLGKIYTPVTGTIRARQQSTRDS